MKDLIKRIKDVLFNEKLTCTLCGKENFNGECFCDECLDIITMNEGVICLKCGREIRTDGDFCLTCKSTHYDFDMARSAFTYEYPIDKLIHDFKYNGKKYIGKELSEYMAHIFYREIFSSDLIVCAPIGKKRLKERGYNQAEILARYLSKKIGIEFNNNIIIKVKETKRQATLSAKEREKNLKGAFRVKNRKLIKDKEIIICDDVLTTGATASEIARVLKNNGAKTVNVLTLASVRDKN